MTAAITSSSISSEVLLTLMPIPLPITLAEISRARLIGLNTRVISHVGIENRYIILSDFLSPKA